jgi:16S rRNA (cytosine967-C5)-methyltransferase
MSLSPARIAAFEVLLRVDREDSYASDLLHSSRHAALTPRDHNLATELAMGVLRWRSLLDQRVAEVCSQPLRKLDAEVLAALRLAAYQLAFLDRVPARAAVHESVELVKRARKRSAVPLVNAVLRKLAASHGSAGSIAKAANPAQLAERSAHPLWLVERWEREFGWERAREICASDQRIPETAVRLLSPDAEQELAGEGIKLEAGGLLTRARRVESGEIAQTPAFQKKHVAIQDEASQLVALLAGGGATILDCCAAPGGKTRLLARRNPDALVVAAELHPHRARLMRRLIAELNIRIIAADALNLPLARQFDRVLADVPCSGTGTLARNPEIKWRLKPEDFSDLQQRQVAILQSAMRLVAAGGRLIYSTCSLEREENEEVVEKALAADASFRILNCLDSLAELQREGELEWQELGSLTRGPYLRTIPGVHPCEGFFATLLEKT